MNAFTYYNPTRIEFGRDKENTVGELLVQESVKRVLLVYGTGSIKKNGLYQRVVASLNQAGVEYVEFGGIVSNPLLSHVYDAIDVVKLNNINAILAVGGGSVIDSAKAIAAGSVVDTDVWDFFYQ